MVTKVLKADKTSLKKASELIRNGEIVAVPTETVYGIAGNAFNGDAIKKIFLAKGRPQDNPLIVHIDGEQMLKDVAVDIPKTAYVLAKRFWPGPLTMVLKKGEKVSYQTTAGLDTVGVRMPSDNFARNLITESGVPFAAPSANVSGKPSPTTAKDVLFDMDGKLPLIIDGGKSLAGVESTVVSLLNEKPIILRPGVITKEDLESVLNSEVLISSAVLEELKEGEKAESPGMKYKHYAPNSEIIILDGDFLAFKKFVEKEKQDGTYGLVFDGESEKLDIPCIEYGKDGDGKSQAHGLFSALRKLDEVKAKKVYARCPLKSGVSLAVYNRLIRSAGFKVIKI